jgi:hypothetical protein
MLNGVQNIREGEGKGGRREGRFGPEIVMNASKR